MKYGGLKLTNRFNQGVQMSYEGKAYQAPSGQWSWLITEDGEDLVRGAGYEREDEALQAMYDQLSEYTNNKSNG